MVRTYNHKTDTAGHSRQRPVNDEREGDDQPVLEGRLLIAQALRGLLRDDGETLTYEQVCLHLGEDGMSCTRAEYEAAWLALHGGEDAKTGRRKLPPGREPPVPARPAESEGDVSEGNGVNGAAVLGRMESARLLRELVRQMGPQARYPEIQEAARARGLMCSMAAMSRARCAVFPGQPFPPGPGKGAAPPPGELRRRVEAAKAATPAQAPPAPAPAPAPQAPPAADPLAQVLDVRRRLAELRQLVEAHGGTLSYKLKVEVSEEVG